jgi:NADH-quinone oxidoreductase subunit J
MLVGVCAMSFVFYILATLTVAGALAAVMLRNTVHAALAVSVAFAGIALLFLSLDAQFAGLAQILVYVGAVAILVVFAILLTRSSEEGAGHVFSKSWMDGLILAAAVFAMLAWAVIHTAHMLPQSASAPSANVHDIGSALMGRYVLPLEIVALLLTAALIGAVIVAMQDKEGAK